MVTARTWLGCVVVVMLGVQAARLDGADAPPADALELLRRSLEHQEVMRRVTLQARVEYWNVGVNRPRTTGVEIFRAVRFDDSLEKVTTLTGQGSGPFDSHTRIVVTPERYVWIPAPAGTRPANIAYAGENVARSCLAARALGGTQEYLDGCIPLIMLRERLAHDVQNLRKVGRERVLGVDCEVIEGETRYGDFRVWIAPNRQYHQMRWRLLMRRHHVIPDLVREMHVRDYGPWETDHGPVEVESKTDEVEVTDFVELEGKLIPRAGVYRTSFRGEDGTQLAHGEYRISRSHIKLLANRAEVEQAFVVDVPDGTYVNRLDDPSGVEYVWRGGRVVRGHTEFTGAAQGRWQPRPIWVYVGWIVLALATAGIALRVWYARRSRLQQEQP